jgi:hypothetical protein
MQVESLDVQRRPSYDSDYPNMLVGMVTLKGSSGKQEIRLSNAALSRVFKVISDEVQSTASANAAQVTNAMGNAVAEYALMEAQKIEAIE